jgi:phosphatidylglycerophosphate synthase
MTAEEVLEGQETCQPFLRYIADTLTIARFFIAALILLVGFSRGAAALEFALIALYIGWITDCVDGTMARKSGTERTWVSHVDLYADVSLIFSFFLFIVITDLFPVFNALAIVAALGLTVCIRPTRAVIKIAVSPFYARPVVLSFVVGFWMGIWFLVFIITFFIIRWDHIIAETRETLLEVTGQVVED